MASKQSTPLKFKPERVIYLHESNTGFKTAIEVIHAIEQLRDKMWLCAYSEKIRPLHLSFNSDTEFQEFKKACNQLNIVLKNPIIKPDDFEIPQDDPIIKPEPKTTFEDPDGKIHIE